MTNDLFETRDEPIPSRRGIGIVMQDPGPEGDAITTQIARQIDRPAVKVNPPRPFARIRRHERRLVFCSWIEQKPRTGLDHGAEGVTLQPLLPKFYLRRQISIKWIQPAMIER